MLFRKIGLSRTRSRFDDETTLVGFLMTSYVVIIYFIVTNLLCLYALTSLFNNRGTQMIYILFWSDPKVGKTHCRL